MSSSPCGEILLRLALASFEKSTVSETSKTHEQVWTVPFPAQTPQKQMLHYTLGRPDASVPAYLPNMPAVIPISEQGIVWSKPVWTMSVRDLFLISRYAPDKSTAQAFIKPLQGLRGGRTCNAITEASSTPYSAGPTCAFFGSKIFLCDRPHRRLKVSDVLAHPLLPRRHCSAISDLLKHETLKDLLCLSEGITMHTVMPSQTWSCHEVGHQERRASPV